MLKPRVHVCLVYNSATSNITPALDPEFRPEEVILVHGPRQRQRSDCLENVLKREGLRVERWPIGHIFDSQHVRDRILELLAGREGDALALNASGGTRPMVIGAHEVFRELEKPVFYVHPETDRITWIHRGGLQGFQCADRIRLPAFLCIHGADQVRTAPAEGIPRNLRRLTGDLIETIEAAGPALAALNWLAQQADNPGLSSPELDSRQAAWHELNALVDRFAAEGLLRRAQGRIRFRDEAARFYTNGGWLEQHVFGVLFGLRRDLPEIQDLARGVQFVRDSSGRRVRNEIDVAFLANNRCYILECKTRRFSGLDGGRIEPDSPGAEALYKLDTLKYLVGETRSRALLVSYRDLPRWDRERALDLGIAVTAGRELRDLKGRLARWIRSQGRPF